MSGNEEKTTWLVRDKTGKIYGPYDEVRLLQFIDKGVLGGDEFISEFPDGKWQPISSHTVLYTKLLQQLSDGRKEKSREEKDKELTNATGTSENEPTLILHKKAGEPKQPEAQISDEDWAEDTDGHTNTSSVTFTKTIESSEDFRPFDNRRRYRIYLMFFFCAIFLFIYISGKKSGPVIGGVELTAPRFDRKDRKANPASEQKQRLLSWIGVFQGAQKEDWLKLKNYLVPFIENNPNNIDAIALLCLTYRELWPYTNKGPHELLVFSKLAQQSTKLDTTSAAGNACKASSLLVSGSFEEADSTVQKILQADPTAAYFYEMKANVLFVKNQKSQAVSYLQQASKFWPTWLKPLWWEAKIRDELGQTQLAQQILQKVLSMNDRHEDSAVYMAFIEYFLFKNTAKAKTWLQGFREKGSNASIDMQGLAFYIKAMIALEDKDKSDFQKYAKLSLTLSPENTNLRTLLGDDGMAVSAEANQSQADDLIASGDRYRFSGRYLEAQAEYKAAFQINPKNPVAAMKAGESLWQLHQEKEAILWLKKSIESNYKFFDANILMADYLSARYQFEEAVGYVKRAQKISSKDYRIYRVMAEIELRRMNYKAAIQNSEFAIKLFDTDVESHLIIGESYLALGNAREAHYALSKAVEIEAKNARAESLYGQALAKFQGYSAGVNYMKNLIYTDPAQIDYRVALAKIHFNNDKYEEAIAVLNQLIDVKREDLDIYFILSDAYRKKGDLQNSFKALLSAAESNPSSAEAHARIAILQYDTGKYAGALSQLQVVAELNDAYPKLNTLLGRTYFKLGDAAKALKYAEIEKRKNPNLVDPILLAADIYMAAGQYTKAASEFQQVIRFSPNSADIYVKMARAYRLSGNVELAQSMLSVASAKESGYPEIYKETGAIFEKLEKPAEAIEAYRKYLQLLPGADDRSAIQATIQRLGGN